MTYQLKRSIITIFFSLGLACLYGQSNVVIRNEEDLKNLFARECTLYNDSLTNSVKTNGTMFFKFKIASDSSLIDIVCSEKQPKVLISFALNVLRFVKISSGAGNTGHSQTYVLPLFYNYAPDPKPVTTLENLLQQIPVIDVNNLQSYINLNYNNLFTSGTTADELWGIKCVLLPPIKVARPIIYQ